MRRTILVIGEKLRGLLDSSTIGKLRQGGIEVEQLDTPQGAEAFLTKRDDALVITSDSSVAQLLEQSLASTERHFFKIYLTQTLIQILADKPSMLGEFLSDKEIDLLKTHLHPPGRTLYPIPAEHIIKTLPTAMPNKDPRKESPVPDSKESGPVKTPPEVPVVQPPRRKLTRIEVFVAGLNERYEKAWPIAQIEKFRQKHARAVDIAMSLLLFAIGMYGASQMTAKQAAAYMPESLANRIYSK